jgi:hypothetical protein
MVKRKSEIEIALNILEVLLWENTTFYQLTRTHKVGSYNKTLEILDELKKDHSIKRHKPTGSRKSKDYEITSRGIHALLIRKPSLYKRISEIVDKHATKFYLFSLWNEIKKHGLKEETIKDLQEGFIFNRLSLEDQYFEHDYFLIKLITSTNQEKWKQIITNSLELHKEINNYLDLMIDHCKKELQDYHNSKKMLNM